MYVCTYACMHVCIPVCVYIYIYIDMHISCSPVSMIIVNVVAVVIVDCYSVRSTLLTFASTIDATTSG